MRVIFKQTIDKFLPEVDLRLPAGARLLSVDNLNEEIVLWGEGNFHQEQGYETKTFISVNTGEEIPENCDYLGTVILHGGVYVRHVYVSKN